MAIENGITAPPAAPPLVSLLTSAVVVTGAERWQGGFDYETETCGLDNTGTFDPCNTGSKTVVASNDTIEVEPFGIWVGESCSSLGAVTRDWQGRVRRKLLACQSRLIESELLLGTQARAASPDWPNKYLTQYTSDTLSAAAVTPTDALACLEEYLSSCNCGAQGMIHASRQVVTHWANNGLVQREGDKILSTVGTIIVPGSGYDGSGPATSVGGAPQAAADGSIWAYATGMVHVYLDDILITPGSIAHALDRTTNLITYRAERLVAYSWDCCHGAVEIDLETCGIGGTVS